MTKAKHAAKPPTLSPKGRKEALRGSSGVKQPKQPAPEAVLEKGRAGRRGVVVYLNPAAKDSLALLARAQGKSLQGLGVEAFNQLFLSYGYKPIA
jgi:hypothetical protein